MSFRPANTSYRKKDNTETIRNVVIGVLIVVLYLWGFGLLGWLFRPVSAILMPITGGDNFIARGLTNFGASWQNTKNLVEETRQLKKENLTLKLKTMSS